jgi:hypothetical protein
MTTKDISGFLSSAICIAFLLMAGLAMTGTALQSFNGLYSSSAPQSAEEREALFNAIVDVDKTNALHSTLTSTDLYNALQNPYQSKDAQAELELANTYKQLQKYNAVYSNSRSEDNWYYWTNMWLNGFPDLTSNSDISGSGTAQDLAKVYGTMANPFAYKDPQAALELANTYKQLQKYNALSSSSNDNWNYWTNMWLDGE